MMWKQYFESNINEYASLQKRSWFNPLWYKKWLFDI